MRRRKLSGIPSNETGRSRSLDEKSSKKSSDSSLTPFHWLLISCYLALVFASCYHFARLLPTPVDQKHLRTGQFCEEFARRHVAEISSFGPRPSGSEANEILTRDYILAQLNLLKPTSNVNFQIEMQSASGCFDIDFISRDYTECYRGVTNILVSLGATDKVTNDAILVNCHFDSVPGSPGATDDAVSCAIMLELIRLLSQSDLKITREIIFLFNGAEENGLQGAHGFITQHPWRSRVGFFINLEGCGAGGRELLFQSGNAGLLQVYLTKSSHPHADSMAQDVFESGIIPSDTDYRIFRDFGNISGVDIGYIHNGYVYHTEFDQVDLISNGSIQRAGENLLSVLKSLATGESQIDSNGPKLVHFDVLGLFVVWYRVQIGTILNTLVAIGTLINFLSLRSERNAMQHYKSAAIQLLSGIVAVVLSITVAAKLVNLCGLTMFWYSRPILLLPTYLSFSLGCSVWAIRKVTTKSLDRLSAERFSSATNLLALGLLLFAAVCKGIASAYLLMFITVFPLLRPLLFRISGKGGFYRLIFTHLACLFVPAVLSCEKILMFLSVLIPTMGRSGAQLNPEIFIGAIIGVTTVSLQLQLGSMLNLTAKTDSLVKWLLSISLLSLLVLLLSDIGIPYRYDPNGPTVRRLYIQHGNRRLIDSNGDQLWSDSGLWVIPVDYRGSKDLPDYTFIAASQPADLNCRLNNSFCGLPFYIDNRRQVLQNSRWMTTSIGPKFAKPTEVQLVSKQLNSDATEVQMNFSVAGSDHISLFLTPLNDWSMFSWSFTETRKFTSGRSYFITLATGTTSERFWKFQIVLKGQSIGQSNSSSTLLIAAVSHVLHGNESSTESLASLISLAKERRAKAHLAHNWWKWTSTISAWTSDMEAKIY